MRDAYTACRIWNEKSEGEVDCYDRFVYLWFAFNVLYNNYFDSYSDTERYAIKKMIDHHRGLFSEQAVNAITGDPAVVFFMDRTIRDCRSSGKDTSEYRIILSQQNRPPISKVKALCMILYQVRCNLFHGNKIFGRESDDQTVRQASIALYRIMEVLCP